MDGSRPAKPRPVRVTAKAHFQNFLKLFHLGQSEQSAKSLQTSSASSLAAASGVGFGTSPHGLSADNPPAHQETRCMAGCRFPAKPLLGEGDALPPSVGCDDASSIPQGWAGVIKLTEEQRSHLAFAVLCQVDDLYECDEANHPDVLEAIRHLEVVQRLLKVQP